jgi:hypothetical protein
MFVITRQIKDCNEKVIYEGECGNRATSFYNSFLELASEKKGPFYRNRFTLVSVRDIPT